MYKISELIWSLLVSLSCGTAGFFLCRSITVPYIGPFYWLVPSVMVLHLLISGILIWERISE